jgi:oxygen-independent coproporphyrinogen III oxidase
LASPIRHLSTYGLTIERGSPFYGQVLRRQMLELDSELQLAMYEHAIDRLTAHQWQHYEVSNFAMVGFRCRHNEAYWLGTPWWAFGPGAASFLHCSQQKSFLRTVNHRSTTTYIRKQQAGLSCVAESEQLSLEDFVRERLVFGLRRLEGVELEPLDRLWQGPVLDLFQPYVDEYIRRGWLRRDENHLRLTRAGLFISDSLWPDLLSSSSQQIKHSSAASDPLSGVRSG